MSDNEGTHDLKETMVSLTSVSDIWLVPTSVDTDCSAGAVAAAMGRDYLPGTNFCWIHLVEVHIG